jgi:hypothetical protein
MTVTSALGARAAARDGGQFALWARYPHSAASLISRARRGDGIDEIGVDPAPEPSIRQLAAKALDRTCAHRVGKDRPRRADRDPTGAEPGLTGGLGWGRTLSVS